MTPGQASAFEIMMPDFGLEYSNQPVTLSDLFGNDNPITLEIGFGMGASLAQQAQNNPEVNFVGIEVHRPGVGSLLARMRERQLNNVRVISHDAVEVLEAMIPAHSLAKVQLFFPDPWHKKRHHKRRIVNPIFVQLVAEKLVSNGIFHMATDWQNYAQHMLAVMRSQPGWKNLSDSDDYVPKPDDRPVTKFQQRGERLGHGVWDLMFQRAKS